MNFSFEHQFSFITFARFGSRIDIDSVISDKRTSVYSLTFNWSISQSKLNREINVEQTKGNFCTRPVFVPGNERERIFLMHALSCLGRQGSVVLQCFRVHLAVAGRGRSLREAINPVEGKARYLAGEHFGKGQSTFDWIVKFYLLIQSCKYGGDSLQCSLVKDPPLPIHFIST